MKEKKDALPPIDEAALKRAEAVLKRLLSSPPDPFTPKQKKGAKQRKKP